MWSHNCSMPDFPVHHQLLELVLKLMSIESVMPSHYLILCHPLLLPSWWKWKRAWKADLKFNIQKPKIMASSPMTSWQIDGETMETVQILFPWAPKSLWMVTAAIKLKAPWGKKIKASWKKLIMEEKLLGRKAMKNLDCILKSRDIILLTKVHTIKAMVLPVVLYGCESWTIQKAEYQRTDSFKLWCWRRLLRVPLTARISSQQS